MLTKKATDSLAIIVPSWINRLKGIFLIPIILHALGLANYGVYVQIMTNVLVLTGVAQLALGQAVLRYGSSVEEHETERLREVFWSPILFCVALSAVLCGVLILAAPLLSRVFLQNGYVSVIAFAAPLVISESVGPLLQIYLNSRRRLKEAALFRFLKDILPYLSFTVLIYTERSLTPGIIAMTATSWLVVGVMWLRMGREVGPPCFRWSLVRNYLGFSWPFAALSVTEGNLASVPRFVVPYFLGPQSLGAFNIVYVLARFLASTNEPLTIYLNSHLPKLWDGGQRVRAAFILDRCEIYFLVVASCGVLLFSGAFGAVLEVGFPRIQQALGSHQTLLLTGLGIFGLLYGLNQLTWVAAKLEERPILILISSVVALGLDIPLTLLMTRHFGLPGTAVAQVLSVAAVQVLLRLALALRLSSGFVRSAVKTLAAATLVGWVLAAIPKASFLAIAVSSVAAVALFALLIYLSRVVTVGEISALVLRRAGSR